jgi:uncharacterized membrane protein SpoIIM required for sporulation
MLALAQAYWNLVRSAKKWLAITLCLFSVGTAGGLVVGLTRPSLIEQMLEHLAGGRETGFPAFILILKHNLFVMLMEWCGSLVLGIVPLLKTVAGGFLFGGLLGVNWDWSLLYCCLTLFPHGIVELPAVLLGSAFFLRLGLRWTFQKTAAERKRIFLTDFQNSIKIGLLCTFLFIIAAMIESFATPKIMATYAKAHLAGIGIQAVIQEHQLTIIHVLPGTPAAKAGLGSGLLIRKIDGTETASKDSKRCRDMVRGRVGTKVTLEVVDPAHSKTNTVVLVREEPKP